MKLQGLGESGRVVGSYLGKLGIPFTQALSTLKVLCDCPEQFMLHWSQFQHQYSPITQTVIFFFIFFIIGMIISN